MPFSAKELHDAGKVIIEFHMKEQALIEIKKALKGLVTKKQLSKIMMATIEIIHPVKLF